MKKSIVLSITVSKDRDTQFADAIEHLELGPLMKSFGFGQFAATLPLEDMRVDKLRYICSSFGVEPWERLEEHYTPSELRQFPLLRLIVRRAPRGSGGPRYGTEYDLSNACSHCGAGAQQVGPLRFSRADANKSGGDMFETGGDELVVSSRLADALREARVSGILLEQLVDYRNNELLDWHQVKISTILPPMDARSENVLRDRKCDACDREGYFDNAKQPTRFIYPESIDVEAAPDIMGTWEIFGNCGIHDDFKFSRFGYPRPLVKPRVYDVLRSAKVRNIAFDPVRVVT